MSGLSWLHQQTVVFARPAAPRTPLTITTACSSAPVPADIASRTGPWSQSRACVSSPASSAMLVAVEKYFDCFPGPSMSCVPYRLDRRALLLG